MTKNIKSLWLTLSYIVTAGCIHSVYSQSPTRFNIELMGSAFASSKKHFNWNTNEHIYYEARFGYKINTYIETSISIGYQLRNYLYFAQFQQPFRESLLVMDRNLFPVAGNVRLYLSEFFYEKLKLWKNRNKWDVYIQLSIASIKGHDLNDPNEEYLRLQGAYVPFHKYPYVNVYNRLQVSYIGGVRYNLNRKFGLFAEGGEGLLTNAVIGLSIRF